MSLTFAPRRHLMTFLLSLLLHVELTSVIVILLQQVYSKKIYSSIIYQDEIDRFLNEHMILVYSFKTRRAIDNSIHFHVHWCYVFCFAFWLKHYFSFHIQFWEKKRNPLARFRWHLSYDVSSSYCFNLIHTFTYCLLVYSLLFLVFLHVLHHYIDTRTCLCVKYSIEKKRWK